MPGPVLILHETTGQPSSCLEGLVMYAREIAKTPEAQAMNQAQISAYLWASPVVFDTGEGPQVQGCRPAQRSRIWPRDLNCWEATAHFAGWAIAQQLPIEIHVIDAYMGKVRHVFPAWRFEGETRQPEALLLQPPVGVQAVSATGQKNLARMAFQRTIEGGRAQAWYNTVADIAHGVGSAVLTVFGAGALVPLVEEAWKAAPEEYGLTKNKRSAAAQDVEKAKAAAEIAKAATVTAAAVVQQATKEDGGSAGTTVPAPPPPPRANALIRPDGQGGFRHYGPPIC